MEKSSSSFTPQPYNVIQQSYSKTTDIKQAIK